MPGRCPMLHRKTRATRFQSAIGEQSAFGLHPARYALQVPFAALWRAKVADSRGSRTRSAGQSQQLRATGTEYAERCPPLAQAAGRSQMSDRRWVGTPREIRAADAP